MSDFPRTALSDLLPLFASGDLSRETQVFIERELAADPALRQELADIKAADPFHPAAFQPPAELAMRSLKRTRRQLAVQRQLYAFAMIFTVIGLAVHIEFDGFRLVEAHLMMSEMPGVFGVSFFIGIALWVAYFRFKKR